MNVNTVILYLTILIVTIILFTKLNLKSFGVLIVFYIIGYGITKDIYKSIAVSLFITYILTLLNDSIFNKQLTESFKNKKSKKIQKAQKKIKENYEDEYDDNDDDDGDNFLDNQESFVNTYKKMTPKQIKGLNKDTRNLIKTQKQLINTLNTMGPSIKESRNILDTFKNYFGNDIDLK